MVLKAQIVPNVLARYSPILSLPAEGKGLGFPVKAPFFMGFGVFHFQIKNDK
jgi:hypothetical protein